MHLPHVPRHIRRRKHNLQPSRHTLPMHRVHIFHPHRHPHSLVGRLIPARTKRGSIRPPSPPSLSTQTKKDPTHPRPHCPKSGRRPPVPGFHPAPFLKPPKAGGQVGYIQNRRQFMRYHARQDSTANVGRTLLSAAVGVVTGEERCSARRPVARCASPCRRSPRCSGWREPRPSSFRGRGSLRQDRCSPSRSERRASSC